MRSFHEAPVQACHAEERERRAAIGAITRPLTLGELTVGADVTFSSVSQILHQQGEPMKGFSDDQDVCFSTYLLLMLQSMSNHQSPPCCDSAVLHITPLDTG